MRKTYDKLVRDRIPEIIREPGKVCEVVTMAEPKFQQTLRQKLVEEAQEAATATEEELVTELADVYEVLDALMRSAGISEAQVWRVQAERGGFQQRLQLCGQRRRYPREGVSLTGDALGQSNNHCPQVTKCLRTCLSLLATS